MLSSILKKFPGGMPGAAFYAVRVGRKTGIFNTWSGPGGAQEQVSGFKSSQYKKFSTLSDAESFMKGNVQANVALHSISAIENPAKVVKKDTKGAQYAVSLGKRFHSKSCPKGKDRDTRNIKMVHPERITVYTDGCCKPVSGSNGLQKIAGVGVNFPGNAHLNISEPLRVEPYTNQRAELQAAIDAIRASHENCFEKICLYTDSKYVINGINEWIKKWKMNGWKTVNKGDVTNKDLWVQLDEVIQLVDVKFVHVFGHTGVEDNEIADRLANLGAEKLLDRTE